MSIFENKKQGGFRDIIRCDEEDYLIWKWHPNGYEKGILKRENEIRNSSILRVRDGEVAVFVCRKIGESFQEFIAGPFEKQLKTANLPILSKIIGLFSEGSSPFQAEVFFINVAKILQIKFGVPYFDVCDCNNSYFSVPVAVRGTINFKIDDVQEFVKFYKLFDFDLNDLQIKIKDTVSKYVRDAVSNITSQFNIPVVALETKTLFISNHIEEQLKIKLKEIYGLSLTSFDIGAIEIDKDTEEYKELNKITKDIAFKKSNIDLDHYEKALKDQREESKYSQRMETNVRNSSIYRLEKEAEVEIAKASALGNVGKNAGNQGMNGLNPFNTMVGLTMGKVVRNEILNNYENKDIDDIQTQYFVATNNETKGPYNFNQIKQLVFNGSIKGNTLIWKTGMESWCKINELSEFKTLIPPDLPPIK